MGVVVVLESKWGIESLTRSANLIKGMRRVALCLLMFFRFFVVVLGFCNWVSALDLKGDTNGWKSWAFVVQIVDAVVIPYPDEDAGQIPMAYVIRKPGSNITEAQVMDFVAKQVDPYKKIRRVAFINSIPKSPARKILKRELVTHALTTGSSKL